MSITKLILLLSFYSLNALASEVDYFESCNDALTRFQSRHVNRAFPFDYEFYGNTYKNGALLLEFFGPMKNSFYEWYHWLESDGSGPPPQGPGLRHFGNGMILEDEQGMRLGTFPHTARMKGSSKEAREARQQILNSLELQLFGLYRAKVDDIGIGALTGAQWDSLEMRGINSSHALELATSHHLKYHAMTSLRSNSKPATDNPLEDFNRVVEVVSHAKGGVIIRVKLGDRGRTLNANEQLIQKMFFITHWQMVQKLYRESELFEDEVKTPLYLLDDFIETMKVSQDQDIYLMYEEAAWKTMLFRMSVAHRFVSIDMGGRFGWQPYFYQTIEDVFFPFYPIFGLIAEQFADGQIEMKRLFYNDNPDPLNRLHSTLKRSALQFHFYHQVAQTFPENTPLIVVSKKPKHTRLYKAFGFTLAPEDSVWKEEWKANKDTLRSTRERFMEKTADK